MNNNLDNNNNIVIINNFNNNDYLIIRLKVSAMTVAPIVSAITSTVIGAFVIARMTTKVLLCCI
jgi:hypothetical protein